MFTLLAAFVTTALARDTLTQKEMIDLGCKDAKVYSKTVEACWRSFNTAKEVSDEAVQKMRFKKPISYSLVCNDGWVSSCGCGGGRGCCSHHGGISGCDIEYINLYRMPSDPPGMERRTAPIEPYLDAVETYVPEICMTLSPPWPWRGINFKRDPKTWKPTHFKILPLQYGMPWGIPLATTAEMGLRYQLPVLKEPAIRRLIPKGAHIGIDPDYIMGWETCAEDANEAP